MLLLFNIYRKVIPDRANSKEKDKKEEKGNKQLNYFKIRQTLEFAGVMMGGWIIVFKEL